MWNAKTLTRIAISLMIGCVFAFALRFGIFVATTDFTYLKIGPFTHIDPKWDGWYSFPDRPNWKYHLLYDKPTLGKGGFPFSTFSDCKMYGLQNDIASRNLTTRCETASPWGDLSIFMNALYWGILITFAWITFKEARKKWNHPGKDGSKTD